MSASEERHEHASGPNGRGTAHARYSLVAQLPPQSGQAKHKAGADGLRMNAAAEGAEAAVGELDDPPVQARNDGVVNAAKKLIFEFGIATSVEPVIVMADAKDRFQIRIDGENVRVHGQARTDHPAVERCVL